MKPGYVEMRIVINDAEALAYAEEWESLLEEAHWKVEKIGGFLPTRPHAGILLEYSDEPSVPIALLRQAALDAGLKDDEVLVSVDQNQEKGKILMLIDPSAITN